MTLVMSADASVANQAFVPRDVDREVVETIRRLLTERKMSQGQLAKEAGVSLKSLNRYLLLQRALSLQDLDRIEEILGPCRTPRVILPAEQPSRDNPMRRDELKLLGIYRALDERRRAQMLGTALILVSDQDDEKERADVNSVQAPEKPEHSTKQS